MSEKNLCDDCANAFACPMQAGIVRTKCSNYKSRSEVIMRTAEQFVTWEWLNSFAEGKRRNYCSDFVAEAKAAWLDKVQEVNDETD